MADSVNLMSLVNLHKYKKDELTSILQKCGLNTNVTVSDGRKLLRDYIASKQQTHKNESVLEMDETDSICFVCDKTISSENWKYKLLETASKKRNVPVADLIKELVGSEFVVLVGERDVVCSSCMNLLNLMDALTAQLKIVQSTLSKHLCSKYNLESDGSQFQVEYDDSTAEPSEPLHKCSNCNYETKYEKEYNMHIRIHNTNIPVTKSPSLISEISNSKPGRKKKIVKKEKTVKTRTRKKKVASKSKAVTKNKKQKLTAKPKKTKIVFQCSICNNMFPDENSIRSHAKKAHGNGNIVVSDESEYEDIQTLESDEEISLLDDKKTSSKDFKPTVKPALDFLEDWNEDEDDSNSAKNSNAAKDTSVKPSLIRKGQEPNKDFDNEDDDCYEEQDQSAKPTCLFCNAKFLSFESVQDHVKMNHRDKTSNLNIGLKISSPVESFEIDSTTDIVENKTPIPSRDKTSALKIKSYKCNLCGIKKVSLKFIKRHVQGHKRKLALQCKLCGTYFRSTIAIKVHRYRCHKVAGVKRKCNQCKLVFVDSDQLNTHIKKVHRKPITLKKRKKSIGLEHKLSTSYNINKHVESSKLPHNLHKPTLKKTVGSKSSQSIHDNTKISSCEVSSTSLENGINASTRHKFICSLCNFMSNSDLEMKGHIKKHNMEENGNTGQILTVSAENAKGNSKLKCPECEISISEPRQLVNHLNRHKANTCQSLGICFYCSKLFLEKEQLAVHLNALHNFKAKPKCTVCGKTYTHGKDLKLHFLRCHFDTKTENLIKQVNEQLLNKTGTGRTDANDIYSKVFKQLQDLTGEGTDIEDDMPVSLPISSLNYSCPLCDFNDCNRNMVENHLSSHPQNYCNICKTLFGVEDSIKHIENHSIEFQNKKCPECEKTFHDSIHLSCHAQRTHSSTKKMYKCSMCEKSYLSEKSLSAHKQTMHGKSSKKVLSCIKCKMNFYTEKEYETHVEFAHRVVLNCKYCDKSLNDMKKLVLHEKNHLKQVKSIYKCNVCGKVLKTLLALKGHKTIHNRNIPLQCEVCSQNFKSFHVLREHSAKHSDTLEKRFFCSVCDKGFYFYDSHYRHRRIHLDPLLFKCKACGERFQTKLKLLEHKKKCSASTQCPNCLQFYSTNLPSSKHVCLLKKSTAFSK